MKPVRAAAIAALLIGVSACGRAAGDKAFDDHVHAYLVAHPEVLLEMQEAYEKKQVSDEAAKVETHIASLRRQIFDDPRDPSIGPKAAKVTVVEFFDYRCPYCKAAAPDYVALIKANPDVRFVFKELPLSIHGPEARAAAAASLASNHDGKYLGVYSSMMADKTVDIDAIYAVLAKAGLDAKKTEVAANDPKISAQIDDVARLATNLGVSGTPGFLVNNHYVAGANMETLTKLIQDEKKKG